MGSRGGGRGGGRRVCRVASSQRILAGPTRAPVEDEMEIDEESVEIPKARTLPGWLPTRRTPPQDGLP